MSGTTYIVRISDKDPFANGQKNVIPYKFNLYHRARKFAEDAVGRGLYAVMHTEYWETEDELV